VTNDTTNVPTINATPEILRRLGACGKFCSAVAAINFAIVVNDRAALCLTQVLSRRRMFYAANYYIYG